MDMITLAMAKAYTDSKGGYSSSYEIKWDGNTDGKVFIPLSPNTGFYKVSNKVLTKEELIGATFVDQEKNVHIISEQNIIDNSAVGVSTQFHGIVTNSSGIPYAVSCKACSFEFMGGTVVVPEDGTYFSWGSNGSVTLFVSELSNETIVPIDQKYLPGVTEVFKLQDYGIDLLTMVLGGQTKVEQDNSVLITAVNNAVSAGMTPLVILHEMMPAHCFVNYAYVNGEMGFSGYLLNGEVVSRIDVIITNQAVFVFPTVLGA